MRTRTFSLPCLVALVAGCACQGVAASPPAYRHSVEAQGIRFEWRVDGGTLFGRVTAPTTGWVLVGFNRESSLDGARLVMLRVRDGRLEAEEHLARPPTHFRRIEMVGGEERVVATSGSESTGNTTVAFRAPLSGDEAFEPNLREGALTHLILAYSHEDDFAHHSAVRTAVDHEL